ncbi:MAG: hypothetical protein JXA99_15420 [Candidatus Lokiarchaeota archaeon]|nr:hypothetical protein [Candidatus Lokiarchaeota archaeon]
MINWIIFSIFLIWIIFKRLSKEGKIEDLPLGLPRGTVRGLITILVVAFTLNYLITKEEIPGIILNAVFILIAFYFEARKSTSEELERIIKEIKEPTEIIEEEKQIKYPLYLPKYSVRILLLSIVLIFVLINYYGPNLLFESRNTLLDVLVIITLFIIGLLIRAVKNYRKNKTIKEKIRNMKDFQKLSNIEIIENLLKEKSSWWQKTGQSILSIFMLGSIIIALTLYTFNIDARVDVFILSIQIREVLLLLINIYYGFRD